MVAVTLDESMPDASASKPEEILALDAALEELSRLEPRQAQMVECRFFAGLDVAETAEVLQVSEATVHRDWRAAKAWLARAVRKGAAS
jgi:RNA polymerase sigma factor (TIGR02999 family)